MDKNQFLTEQLDLIKRKQTDSSIEWQDVADFRANAIGELEHRDTIRKRIKIIIGIYRCRMEYFSILFYF